MKYFSRLYVSLMIIVFTFSGCEDTFETTLEINPPEHADRLVVHAYGSTNGEDLKVYLTQSSGLLESLQNNLISKATVTLWKDQVQLAELEEVSFGSNYQFNYILPEGTIVYEKGATYRLDVSGSIGATADVVAYISSDKRLKDNIKNIANPLEKLNKLNGIEFDWNDKQDLYKGHDIGVIAQEVEEVLPEIVDTREDGDHKAVKYDRMVALLIEAVKEQQVQINELKTKLGE